MGIVGIIAGLFLLNHPLFSGAMITYYVVFGFIFMGFQNIIFCFTPNSGEDTKNEVSVASEA